MWGVEYIILGKKYYAGLYETEAEAKYQANDIAGYEGVSNVKIYTVQSTKQENN